MARRTTAELEARARELEAEARHHRATGEELEACGREAEADRRWDAVAALEADARSIRHTLQRRAELGAREAS